MPAEIDTGDIVRHGPTGEIWVVARVRDDKLAWCGWPPGWADLKDCTLSKKATPTERTAILEQIAGSKGHHCADWAASRLKEEHHG